MTSKMMKHMSKAKHVVLFSAPALSVVGGVALNTVSADSVTAGSFDLTKQASEATFPVMFDRPSGVNAAALAATVRNLGSDSQLYKSAVASVPELADGTKMASLLADSLSTDASTQASARATIVKLINWYNSLGGTKITTQAGAEYTVDNLDEPINVLAVAFSNNSSINADVSRTIDQDFKQVRTVEDVMNILDKYAPGTSSAYKQAFEEYVTRYNAVTDKSSVSNYASVKPVLDAYESMYANGAAAIRKQLLANQSASTEAGVAFFESAIISGETKSTDNGSSNNTPIQETILKTRWVTDKGEILDPEESGSSYKEQREYAGYTYKEVKTENGIRTYVYTKKETPVVKTADTVWVDEAGNILKAKVDGTYPDNDGKSDIEGMEVVSTTTKADEKGNLHTINVYRKIVTPVVKPDTYWFDTEGVTLKEKAIGQTLPDNDGKSDIDGYDLVRTYTVTEKDVKSEAFKDSTFKVGDTINIYKKKEAPKETPKVEKKSYTSWREVGTETTLAPDKDGLHPDEDGQSDIKDYVIVGTKKLDENGVTHYINYYEKVQPEQPKEEPKKPEPKKPEPKPEQPKQELPKTGDAGSLVGLVGVASVAGGSAGLANVLKKRSKRKTEK